MADQLAGGNHHNARRNLTAAQALDALVNGIGAAARDAHLFKVAVVRSAADLGIEQILNLGCGTPREPTLADVARRAGRPACVVHVENDPLTAGYGRALLETDGNTVTVEAACLSVAALDHPAVRGHIDLDRPVCLLLVAAAHTAPLASLRELVFALAERLAPGSLFAVSQWTTDNAATRWMVNDFLYEQTHGTAGTVRSTEEVSAAFEPHLLLGPPPGPVIRWQPAPGHGGDLIPLHDGRSGVVEFGAVIRLPGPGGQQDLAAGDDPGAAWRDVTGER
ncbi:SAM-dependent methyltransferase [Kitasatospora sp. NPDC092286]|uniref:SAM-dependent methyltransferase n=1 Tax=Kitasatospora sp. NPDC092286 TaxID=3364087 RepID=UPI0038190154